MMMHGAWHGTWSWWWIPMTIMMIAIWGGIAWLLVTVTRSSDSRPTDRSQTPREVLDQRFARGGMSAEEYQQHREMLQSSRR
jgi:uncharacterized membrane protein